MARRLHSNRLCVTFFSFPTHSFITSHLQSPHISSAVSKLTMPKRKRCTRHRCSSQKRFTDPKYTDAQPIQKLLLSELASSKHRITLSTLNSFNTLALRTAHSPVGIVGIVFIYSQCVQNVFAAMTLFLRRLPRPERTETTSHRAHALRATSLSNSHSHLRARETKATQTPKYTQERYPSMPLKCAFSRSSSRSIQNGSKRVRTEFEF